MVVFAASVSQGKGLSLFPFSLLEGVRMAVRNISKLVSVDESKKYVFCDVDNATEGALATVKMYLDMGYKLNPKLRGGDKRGKEYWLGKCETKAQKDKFEAICKGNEEYEGKSGFFSAKKYVKKEILGE